VLSDQSFVRTTVNRGPGTILGLPPRRHSVRPNRIMRLGAWLTIALCTCVAFAWASKGHELTRMDVDAHLPYAVLPSVPISIQDLELSNVLLVTTVDGRLHGLDRTSGSLLWSFPSISDNSVHAPLVTSKYDHRSMEQLAKDARDHGDPTLVRALQEDGIYIVEPSSGGDMYILRVPPGATIPTLEKLPFTLPDLVSISPFTLHAEDPRIFVAEKHTSLMELNVFTGTVRAVYSSSDTGLHHATSHALDPRTVSRSHSDTDGTADDAIESPWVLIGRTDYTLYIHVRHVPHAVQTLQYQVFSPNIADRDVMSLWHQSAQPADKRAFLSSPENATVLCYDLRLARNPHRHTTQPLPPVLWTSQMDSLPVDIYDVVFAPSDVEAPLLRPVPVPHNAGFLSRIILQHQGASSADELSAFLGLAPDGSLFALGSTRYPLAGFAERAAVLNPEPHHASSLMAPWIGGYRVRPPLRQGIPLLGASQPVLQLEAPPSITTEWRPSKRLVAQLVGLLAFALMVLRGAYLIWRESRLQCFDTSNLCFDEDKVVQDTSLESAPSTPMPEHTPERPESEPRASNDLEADPKRRRRRRGKRAGAAVSARQARREESLEPIAPESPPTVNEGESPEPLPTSLQISDEILGYGSSGTVVFRGTFQGRAVAVKRLLRDFVHLASKEVSLLQSADNHPNVIRYYCQELTPNFLYIALEECPASLADLIERPLDYASLAALLEPRQAFKQITAGLQHLHSLSIVHRDIKPGNILVTLTPQNKLRVLLSDLGLSKRIDGLTFSAQSQSAQAGGTMGWRAPELLQGFSLHADDGKERLTRAVDIFSLGCVAFYMLTRGGHPFGELYEREIRILQNQVDTSALSASGDDTVEAEALIKQMIAPIPSDRPSASDVARHPFFWNAAKRVAFLQDVSDRFETLERTPPSFALELLEQNAESIVGPDWRRRFDKNFLDDLGKFRTYNSASVQDLLRVIRNKKHHFQDMPIILKKQLSPMPEGFLLYFTRRFPTLFLHVYGVLEQLPQMRTEPTFTMYYESEDTP